MIVFTSCNALYLPKAIALARSVKEHNQGWKTGLVLADAMPFDFPTVSQVFDEIVLLADLNIPDLERWIFYHNVVELCTAVKGFAFMHFQKVYEKVIYLDPDILVMSQLADLDILLDAHNVLLTPHYTQPQESLEAIEDNEMCALKNGVYNLGFLALASRGSGLTFAEWWAKRLYDYCYDDKARGLFTDQKWCDMAPAIFDDVYIIKNPGYNVASWNLSYRSVINENGEYWVNGELVKFYHFTGFDSGDGRIMTAKYSNGNDAINEIWRSYSEAVDPNRYPSLLSHQYRYGYFTNGKKIKDWYRRIYRDSKIVKGLIRDPYVWPSLLVLGRIAVEIAMGFVKNKLRGIRKRMKALVEKVG